MVSYLKDLLGEFGFATVVETSPAFGADAEEFLKAVRAFKKAKFDLVSVRGAAPYANKTMSSIAGCALSKKYHAEPILHVSCQNRNAAAIEADLVGAAALEIETVIVHSGDLSKGRIGNSGAVYDTDPARVFKMITALNSGKTLDGGQLASKCALFVGGAISVNVSPIEIELLRVRRNSLAGCNFFVTNPLFGLSNLRRFLLEYEKMFGEEIGKRVLISTVPLTSLEVIAQMKKIPGVYIPPDVEQALKAEENKRDLGVKFAAVLVKEAKKLGLGGANLISIGEPEIAAEVKERLGGNGKYPEPVYDNPTQNQEN